MGARADRTESLGGCLKNVFTCNGPENRYLYLGANTDSKKFLLFLMEMYHPGLTDRETEVFSRAAAVSIPTIFQELNAEGEQLVNEYIQARNTENAEKFTEMITMAEVNTQEFLQMSARTPRGPESFEVPPYSRNTSIQNT